MLSLIFAAIVITLYIPSPSRLVNRRFHSTTITWASSGTPLQSQANQTHSLMCRLSIVTSP
jgi:hypothetical protein